MSGIDPIQGEALKKALENQQVEPRGMGKLHERHEAEQALSGLSDGQMVAAREALRDLLRPGLALENQHPKAVSPTGEPYLPPRMVRPLMGAYLALSGLAGYLALFEADPLARKVGVGIGLVLAALGPLLGLASPGWRRAGKVLVALLAVGLSTGCVNFRPPAPPRVASLAPEAAPFEFSPPPECKAFDRDRKVWGALGRSAALGSGAAGLTSLVTDNDSGGLRRGFGLASLALGIFAAGASWYADQQAADYVSRCTQ